MTTNMAKRPKIKHDLVFYYKPEGCEFRIRALSQEASEWLWEEKFGKRLLIAPEDLEFLPTEFQRVLAKARTTAFSVDWRKSDLILAAQRARAQLKRPRLFK